MCITIGDKQAEAETLAEELLGTDNMPPEHLAEDLELAEQLDELVKMCDTCGKWTEILYLDDDHNCPECN